MFSFKQLCALLVIQLSLTSAMFGNENDDESNNSCLHYQIEQEANPISFDEALLKNKPDEWRKEAFQCGQRAVILFAAVITEIADKKFYKNLDNFVGAFYSLYTTKQKIFKHIKSACGDYKLRHQMRESVLYAFLQGINEELGKIAPYTLINGPHFTFEQINLINILYIDLITYLPNVEMSHEHYNSFIKRNSKNIKNDVNYLKKRLKKDMPALYQLVVKPGIFGLMIGAGFIAKNKNSNPEQMAQQLVNMAEWLIQTLGDGTFFLGLNHLIENTLPCLLAAFMISMDESMGHEFISALLKAINSLDIERLAHKSNFTSGQTDILKKFIHFTSSIINIVKEYANKNDRQQSSAMASKMNDISIQFLDDAEPLLAQEMPDLAHIVKKYAQKWLKALRQEMKDTRPDYTCCDESCEDECAIA